MPSLLPTDALPPPVIATLAESSANVLPVGLPAFHACGVACSRPRARRSFEAGPRRTPLPGSVAAVLAGAPLAQAVPAMRNLGGSAVHAGIVTDRPSGDREMDGVVPVRGHQREILDAIIEFVPVDVVDVHALRDRSEMALPNDTVFEPGAAPAVHDDANRRVSVFGDLGLPTLPAWVTIAPASVRVDAEMGGEGFTRIANLGIRESLAIRSSDAGNRDAAHGARLRADQLSHAASIPVIEVYRHG